MSKIWIFKKCETLFWLLKWYHIITNTDALSLRSERNGTKLERTSLSTNVLQGSAYGYYMSPLK